MKLILTYYVDKSPETVKAHLAGAVRTGIDATADLAVPSLPPDVETERVPEGIRVHGGNTGLDGSEGQISGTDLLTTVRFEVPWETGDTDTQKLRAASRFAATVADEVLTAA